MTSGGKVVEWQEMSCYSGHIVACLDDIPDDALAFNWNGAPIPTAMWLEIKAFFLWSFQTHNCEAQVRLSYNEVTKEWRTVVFPQYISAGLFTEEIKVHKDREDIFKAAGIYDGFSFVGTVHHHCSASAFQSGTDHKDEITQPGYHVTLGHLNGPVASFHSRGSFRGVMYDKVDDNQWLPYSKDVTCSLENLPEFPKEWEARLEKKPVRTNTTYYSKRGGYWCTQQMKWVYESKPVGGKKGKKKDRRHSGITTSYESTKMPAAIPLMVSSSAAPSDVRYTLKYRNLFWSYMRAAFNVHGYYPNQKGCNVHNLNEAGLYALKVLEACHDLTDGSIDTVRIAFEKDLKADAIQFNPETGKLTGSFSPESMDALKGADYEDVKEEEVEDKVISITDAHAEDMLDFGEDLDETLPAVDQLYLLPEFKTENSLVEATIGFFEDGKRAEQALEEILKLAFDMGTQEMGVDEKMVTDLAEAFIGQIHAQCITQSNFMTVLEEHRIGKDVEVLKRKLELFINAMQPKDKKDIADYIVDADVEDAQKWLASHLKEVAEAYLDE